MPVIVSNNAFNPAALQVDDLYVVVQPPPSFITGVPSDVAAVVGTAGWGAKNTPQLLGTPADLVTQYGGILAASATDIHDMPTDVVLAFTQANGLQGTLQIWGVRVTDGTDVAASGVINDSTAAAGATITALYTGSLGNQVAIVLSAGAQANTVSVAVIGFNGTDPEYYPNIPSSSGGSFWANLQAALLNGLSGIRGPSQLARVTQLGTSSTVTNEPQTPTPTPNGTAVTFTGTTAHGNITPGTFSLVLSNPSVTAVDDSNGNLTGTGVLVGTINYVTGAWAITYTVAAANSATMTGAYHYQTPSVHAPAIGTTTLSSGTDGRSVTTANMVGSDTAVPRTGIYSLRNLQPAVGIAWVAGLVDTSAYSAIAAMGDSEGIVWEFSFNIGTTTANAVAIKQALGITTYNAVFVKDWIYFYDPTNGVVRAVPPYAVAGGLTATLNPALSPGNKAMSGIVGTERYNTNTGTIVPYSQAELGQLESNGIALISNPCPGGNFFGIRGPVDASGNAVQSPIEYARMTNWLARTFAANMGQFVNQNQSTQPNDPLRNAVKLTLDGFLQILQDESLIDSYQTICGFQNSTSAPQAGYNTPTTIGQHYLYALAMVRYMSSVKFFVLELLGGTTVVTVLNSLNQGLTGAQA